MRRLAPALACLVLVPLRREAPPVGSSLPAEAPCVAFSLREASRRAQAGARGDEVWKLGGITRLFGAVIDPRGDVVLLGRRVAGLPAANLTDLAGALRARLVHGEWPELSIDPDEQTAVAGTLAVTTRGGIHGSSLHAVLQEADVFLKRYAMQQTGPIALLPSYAELMVAGAEQRVRAAGATVNAVRWLDAEAMRALTAEMHGRAVAALSTSHVQFWFAAKQPFACKAADGVFGITELQLCVQVKRLGSNVSVDEDGCASAFARAFTDNLDAAAERCAAVRRLKALYDMVAIAEGLRGMSTRPDLTWLLGECPVADAGASDRYPATDLCALLERSDGGREVVQLAGGVDLRTEIAWLNDGDLSPLRRLVLAHRPAPDSLCWEPPLQGWRMPNMGDVGGERGPAPNEPAPALADEPGSVVFAQHYTFATQNSATPGQASFHGFLDFPRPVAVAAPMPAPGGVSMRMPVRARAFRLDRGGLLDRVGSQARRARPSGQALSWPVGEEKKR